MLAELLLKREPALQQPLHCQTWVAFYIKERKKACLKTAAADQSAVQAI